MTAGSRPARGATKRPEAEAPRRFTRNEWGQGVSRDPVEAAHWYRLAAEQGHRDAQFNLGACYANGWGVSRDLVQAEKWFEIAAKQGDEDSVKAKERLAARISAAEMKQAQELAKAWTPCKEKAECEARILESR